MTMAAFITSPDKTQSRMQIKDFIEFIDKLPEAYILINSKGQILAVSQTAVQLLDIQHDVSGENLSQLVSISEDKLKASLRIWSRSRSPTPANLDWKSLTPEQKHNIQCQAFLVQPASANELAILILRCTPDRSMVRSFMELNQELMHQKDVLHKLMESRNALEEEHEKALVTLGSIGDAVITTDNQAMIEFLNPVAEKLTGWSNKKAQGKHISDIFNIIDETTRQTAKNPVVYCLKEGHSVELTTHTVLVSKDGTNYVIEDSAAPILTHEGDVLGVVLVFRDKTSDHMARRQLEYLAQHDALTGLKNRFYFEQQLSRVVDVAARGKHYSALLYLDLDQFKIVNDTAGHTAGDELLVEVARLLSERLRQGDILARLGGDEFGIIVDNTEGDQLRNMADSFNQALRDSQFRWDGNKYAITCSIGAMVINENTGSSAEAMRQADIACYAAKDEGRNRYHIYNSEEAVSIAALTELNVVNSLKSALTKDGFLLHFQPIMDISTDTIVSHEVLIRLKQADGSLIAPGNFIPIAERNGFMSDIDKWVLEKSMRMIADKKEYKHVKHLTVNLSGQSMNNPEIIEMIKQFIRKDPEFANRLGLEITETSAVTHIDKAIIFIKELKALGVCFALDDFGTGFSSFAYLKNLPVDYIKIDGAFVRDIVNNPVDNAMVHSMNNIAHSLNKKTVAEFVENAETLELLREIGVDMVQGYYIGKPLPDIAR